VIRSRHVVAWMLLCGTAFGFSTPIGDGGTTQGAAALIGGAAEQVDAALASAMASVAAPSAFQFKLPEPAAEPFAIFVGDAATPESDRRETAIAAKAPVSDVPLVASAPPLETQVQFASVSTPDPVKEYPKPTVRPVETPDECLVVEICIDEYLWSVYERTPKIDINKVEEQTKETVKKKNGKVRTIIKTITKFVLGDFTWKDPAAAKKASMSLKDYVIGGLDRGFKLKLYHALRAMDDAGFMPGITSAFRDDYRQSITIGNKAASDSSYHGGSRRGGYGHALAVDIVSVNGQNRTQRTASSEELWKWIDAHEKELGVGRPYLDKDPPHVGPIDGKEYADKRGRTAVQKAGLKTNNEQDVGLETRKRRVKLVSTHRRAPQPEQ
jgi:hypothetical protein